jgi:ABC-type glycerol-3-phosphate transport system substrate-binding protein
LTDFGQAYPNLQVRVVVKEAEGRGGLMDFIRTASVAAPSVLPDLVVLDTASLRVATQQGLLQPMDDLLPTSLAGDRFPFASMLGDVDGQTMGATLAAELEHLAYWPGLVARPPLTWTAVISAESQLAFPAAGLEGGIHDFTLAQYLSAGGRLVSEEDSPQIDEGALAAVLSFYAQAISTGVISPTTILNLADTDECWEIFRSQEVGMAVVNSRRFWTDRELAALPAPLPAPNGGSLTLAEGWAIGLVTSNPDRQRQAMLLLEWLLAPEHSGPWTQASGYLPPTFSASQEWNVTEGEREVLEAILAGAISQPDPNTRAATAPAMQAALEDVLSGQRSPEDAAAEAADSFTP